MPNNSDHIIVLIVVIAALFGGFALGWFIESPEPPEQAAEPWGYEVELVHGDKSSVFTIDSAHPSERRSWGWPREQFEAYWGLAGVFGMHLVSRSANGGVTQITVTARPLESP